MLEPCLTMVGRKTVRHRSLAFQYVKVAVEPFSQRDETCGVPLERHSEVEAVPYDVLGTASEDMPVGLASTDMDRQRTGGEASLVAAAGQTFAGAEAVVVGHDEGSEASEPHVDAKSVH